MRFIRQEITFDRFIRGLLLVLLFGSAICFLRWLSPVLTPFAVAWAFAWMLRPVVTFLERRCHIPWRWLSVLLTLSGVTLLAGALLWCIVPIASEGIIHIKDSTLAYLQSEAHRKILPPWIESFVQQWLDSMQIKRLLAESDIRKLLQTALPRVWEMLLSTVNVVLGLAASAIGMLYLIFLLMDYERFSRAWLRLLPQRPRRFAAQLVGDLERGMRGYFRGQALVALSNTLMFAIGFWIIDLPMGVGLGIFVGLISFVPYIQVVGIVPAALLALLKMTETGSSFWTTMLLVLLVYVVVQVLQDVVFTPRIMGEITGLSPAIILLSLSVWGFMAGIVGLIVGLPLTALAIAYYKRYVLDENDGVSEVFNK